MKKCIGILVMLAAGFAAYLTWIRPRIVHWGITEDEAQRSFPGDDLTPNAKLISTHAITIHAPASAIWPWLVQIGNGRAGWYSYRFIERLVQDGELWDEGASHRILPEFQNLQVGDYIPVGKGAFQVMELKPEHYLIMQPVFEMMTGNPTAVKKEPVTQEKTSFALILEPITPQTTRLIARARVMCKSLPTTLYTVGFFEPGHFIMQTEMLRGIKQRAEANRHTESA